MPAGGETLTSLAASWLSQFERALAETDGVLLETLFHPGSHWRDALALTWHIRTVSGLDAIVAELQAHVGSARPTGFRTDPDRTAPRYVTRAGTNAIEAIFRFETAEGQGSGVLRLTPDADDGNTQKAWTLLTALDDLIKGIRGTGRTIAAARQIVLTRFSGPQLAGPQGSRRPVCRPGSGRARGWRRPGRAFDRRTPHAFAGRYADRGPRAAHR